MTRCQIQPHKWLCNPIPGPGSSPIFNTTLPAISPFSISSYTAGSSSNGRTYTFGLTSPSVTCFTASKHSFRFPTRFPWILIPLITISATLVSIRPPPGGIPMQHNVPPTRSIEAAWAKAAEDPAQTMTLWAPPWVSRWICGMRSDAVLWKSMKVTPNDSTSSFFSSPVSIPITLAPLFRAYCTAY